MNARELFLEGRFDEAIQAQNQAVKSRPTDVDARYFLFVLLSFTGNLERASTILDGLVRVDGELAQGTAVYQSLLASEYERQKVWRDGAKPVFPPDEPDQLRHRLEALRADSAASLDAALESAVAHRTPLSGKLNGEPFDDLRDGDDVLASVLEVHAGGRYLWIPLENVRSLEVQTPSHDIDLLWVPATLEDTSGDVANVHLPALYPESHKSIEPAARVGRITEWGDAHGVAFRGVGQKIWMAARGDGALELPLLEVRHLEIASP